MDFSGHLRTDGNRAVRPEKFGQTGAIRQLPMNLLGHLLILFAINSILVAGMGLIIGVGGVAALNAGAFAAVGAYTYGVATTHFHCSGLSAFLLATAAGLLFGWIISSSITRLAG